MAVLEDSTRVQIGSLRVRHQPLRTSFQPTLQPITLTCLGRTGTTWLMRMFASHPEVAVYRRFPYESSTAKYWMQMLEVLAEPSNMVQSTHPDTFHNDVWQSATTPSTTTRRRRDVLLALVRPRPIPSAWPTFCQQSIEDWYLTLAGPRARRRALFRREAHVAELHPGAHLRELYPPAKEVFLVRDFRDMARSIMAFDRKRRGWPALAPRRQPATSSTSREAAKWRRSPSPTAGARAEPGASGPLRGHGAAPPGDV